MNKIVYAIRDLQVQIIFKPDYIRILDLKTKRLIQKIPLDKEFTKIKRERKRKYSFLLFQNGNYVANLYTGLERSIKAKTHAEFIVQVGTSRKTKYFIGLYEFGTFFIQQSKIKIDKSVIHDSMSYGLFNDNNKTFLLARAHKGIECWDWRKKTPVIKWCNPDVAVLKGMVLTPKKTLLVGTTEGKIIHLDKQGVKLGEYEFIQESIKHMIWEKDCICLTNSNYIYRFKLEGKLVWKTKLDAELSNNAVTYFKHKLWISTYQGIILTINLKTGAILKKYKLKKDSFSPIAIYRKNIIIHTSPEYLHFTRIRSTYEEVESIRFPDRMVRALAPVQNGIVVGDDYGELTFLKGLTFKLTTFGIVNTLKHFNP